MDILYVIYQKEARAGSAYKSKNTQALERQDAISRAGKHFTFFKFLDLLMKCAKLTFCGYSTGAESQIYSNFQGSSLLEAEMICLMLERMELSAGFINIQKKTNRPLTSRFTLLPSKQVIQNLTLAKNLVTGMRGKRAIASIS